MKVCRKCAIEKLETDFYTGRCVCKECIRSRVSGYYAADKERWKARVRKYEHEHRDEKNAWNREWRKKHPEEAKLGYARHNAKMRSSVCGRLRDRVGTYLRQMLREGKEGRKLVDILGYTIAELKQHLESKFVDGMCWERLDEIHIDHVIPVSAFKFASIEDPQFKQCWALSNLQPLRAADNLSKGNKYSCEDIPQLVS